MAQAVKNLPAAQEMQVQLLGSGRSPGGGNGNPLQYFCLGNPKEGCLAGYIPSGRKESDMTELVMDEKKYYNGNKNI